ncbi:MAG: DUF1640 domain-containing protein [Magnetococcales bacterium]|nr:DUF1640 domain-containing protein [Magnetococcales bacterium]MBF0156008.1 DUF1640 domain-containing protein [Magnetococcales bacterium]
MSIAVTFDTHAYIKRLRSAGVPESQAEAQAETLNRALDEAINGKMAELATKGDLWQLETKLDSKIDTKIAEAKADLIKWMFGVAAGQAMFIIAILKMFPSR